MQMMGAIETALCIVVFCLIAGSVRSAIFASGSEEMDGSLQDDLCTIFR